MLVPLLTLSHVPTYKNDQCKENCCIPEHLNYNVSQVLYLKGTGGMEIPLFGSNHPETADEIPYWEEPFRVYYDIVVKDFLSQEELNQLEVYVGCGGCVESEDEPVDGTRITDLQLQAPHLEPFTQTRYYSIFKPDDPADSQFRSFSSYDLLPDENLGNCSEKHMTVRLRDGRPDPKTVLVWGAVIGREERFTPEELISFPIFVLKNHGEDWNDKWWTILIVIFSVIFLVYLSAWACYRCRVSWRDTNADGTRMTRIDCCACSHSRWPAVFWKWLWPKEEGEDEKRDVKMIWKWLSPKKEGRDGKRDCKMTDFREILYRIAQLSFLVAAFEELVHVWIAASGLPEGIEIDTLAGYIIVFVSQIIPLLFTMLLWRTVRYRKALHEQYEMENCRLCCYAYKAFDGDNMFQKWRKDRRITPVEYLRRGEDASKKTCLRALFERVSCFLCFKCVRTTIKNEGKDSEIYLVDCWTAMTSPSFAILEIASGILLFFWFGAGFFVGPTAIILSGFIRLLQMCFDKNETEMKKPSQPSFTSRSESFVGTTFDQIPIATPIPNSLEKTPLLAWKINLNDI